MGNRSDRPRSGRRRKLLTAVGGLLSLSGCLRSTTGSDTETTSEPTPATTQTVRPTDSQTDSGDGSSPTESDDGSTTPKPIEPAASFWRKDFRSGVPPEFANGRLFSAHNADDEVGTPTFRRLSTDSGEVQWERTFPAERSRNDEITGFISEGDSLWVANTNYLARLDGETGETVWRRPFGTHVGIEKVDDKLVVVRAAWDDNYVRVVSAADGSDLWRATCETRPIDTFEIAGGTVVVTLYDNRLQAFSLDDGTELWIERYAQEDGHLFMTSTQSSVFLTSEGSPIVALDPEENSTQWEYDTSLTDDMSGLLPGLTSDDDTLYLSVSSLHAINTADGSPKWSTTGVGVPGNPKRGPEGYLYCYGGYQYGDRNNIETFFQLERGTGRVNQHYPTPFRPDRYPGGFAVGDGAIYARLYSNTKVNQLMAIKKNP